MTPDLPMELWLRVIDYLCLKDRRSLVFAQVNRQFLDLAQDELFSQLNLTISVPFLLDSVAKRVLYDHHISRRVRVLSLHPGALFRWLYPCPSSFLSSCRVHRKQKMPTLFSNVINRLTWSVEELRLLLNGPVHWHPAGRSCLLFHHHLDHYPVDLVQNFADCIWTTLGKRLVTLEIVINPSTPVQMLPPLGVLGRLKHLEVRINGHNGVMVARFASLINSFSSNLESLSIDVTDEFYLIDSIGTLPHLKHLDLCMKSNAYMTSSRFHFPSRLLQANQSIQVLRFHWTEPYAPINFTSVTFNHLQWILPNLRTLELKLEHQDDDPKWGRLMKPFASLSNSLTTLSYIHLPLSWQDLQDVLTSFVLDKLLDLSVFVFSITPQVIDLIAKRCPSLLKLTLIADHIGPVHVEPSYVYKATNDMLGFLQEISVRKDCHLYSVWGLRDLTALTPVPQTGAFWDKPKRIHKGGYGFNCDFQLHWMLAIAYVIPSITSFLGKGHKHVENDLTSDCDTKAEQHSLFGAGTWRKSISRRAFQTWLASSLTCDVVFVDEDGRTAQGQLSYRNRSEILWSRPHVQDRRCYHRQVRSSTT